MRKRENAKTLFKILRKRENVFVVFVLEKRKTVSSKNAKTGKRFRGFRDKRLKIGAIFHENRENENVFVVFALQDNVLLETFFDRFSDL